MVHLAPSYDIFPTWLSQLSLFHFRNYTHHTITATASPQVITGPNGSGKTNILEAISLLGGGRGLRRATLSHLQNYKSDQPWALNIRLWDNEEELKINMGVESLEASKKIVKVNGTITPVTQLAQWVQVVWLTPFMDQLFLESPGRRRTFMDRLILPFDYQHASRLAKLEYALKERNRLLRDAVQDTTWLDTLEDRIAQESVAIMASRQHFLHELNETILEMGSAFPQAQCKLVGPIAQLLLTKPALEVEDEVRRLLAVGRRQDNLSGGGISAQQSDLSVYHLDFRRPAEVCSTGEQKALLLSMVLAQARLIVAHTGRPPLILLDEVVAHLDQARRCALFKEILALRMQGWLTGTDRDLFKELEQDAHFLSIPLSL